MAALSPPPPSPSLSREQSRGNTSQTHFPENDTSDFVEEEQPTAIDEQPLISTKFDENTINSLSNLTPPEIESILAKLLSYKDYKVSLTDGAMLDYYVGGFLFTTEQKFTASQTSCFMGLLDKILENCKANMKLEENLKEFVTFLSSLNQQQVAGSKIDNFDKEQIKQIIDFVYQGIFQHYKLYQNMFKNDQKEELLKKMSEIDVVPFGDVPFPPPLHESMPMDLYEKHVAPPQSTKEEAAQSEEQNDFIANDTCEALEDGTPTRPQSKNVNTAEMILKSLKPDEIKGIVAKMTTETLQNVKAEATSKIKEREAVMVSKLNKLHLT